MSETVVVFGSDPSGDQIVERVAREYGWSLKRARDISALRKMNEQWEIVAVLFQTDESENPNDLISAIRAAAPGAKPILCHRFSDAKPWPAIAAAGAFHSLLVPFAVPEVHQSLGFVWAALSRPKLQIMMKTRKAVA